MGKAKTYTLTEGQAAELREAVEQLADALDDYAFELEAARAERATAAADPNGGRA